MGALTKGESVPTVTFTSGPWLDGGESSNQGESSVVVSEHGRTVAYIANSYNDAKGGEYTSDEDKANLALVRSAPAIFTALMNLVLDPHAAPLLRDSALVALHEAGVGAYLSAELQDYCREEKLPQQSADELMAMDLTDEQQTWLGEFLDRWDLLVG